MKMKWLGHASFLIESPGGLKVVTDPFGKDVPYPEIDETADVVTVSHEHHDHNAVHVLKETSKWSGAWMRRLNRPGVQRSQLKMCV